MGKIRIKQKLSEVYRYFRPFSLNGQNNILKVLSKKEGRLRVTVYGKNNSILIDRNVYLLDVNISIYGDNNTVQISSDCRLYNLNLRIHGKDSALFIGENVGVREADIIIMEGRKVTIGNDCMLSYGIHIRTSDSHKIFDKSTGIRVNEAKDVVIGHHCWIAQNVTLLKGADIGDSSIVGYGSVCSHSYPEHCIIVGIPGQIIKDNIDWSRRLD